MTTDPKNPLPPRLDPTCTCICHTQPGVMHVAPCCREADPKDAEIARLSASRIDIAREADRLQARTEKAEAKVITLTEQVDAIAAHRDEVMAERDAALAQVAGAYEAAAQITENDKTLHEWEHTAAIRALTPAHALAALSRRDAQMRTKGMRKAAEIVERFGPPDWEATAGEILAAAEKEKGKG